MRIECEIWPTDEPFRGWIGLDFAQPVSPTLGEVLHELEEQNMTDATGDRERLDADSSHLGRRASGRAAVRLDV